MSFSMIGVKDFAKQLTLARMALTLAVSPAQAGAQFELRDVLHKLRPRPAPGRHCLLMPFNAPIPCTWHPKLLSKCHSRWPVIAPYKRNRGLVRGLSRGEIVIDRLYHLNEIRIFPQFGIDRQETQRFAQRLRDQHAIKRIAVNIRERSGTRGVFRRDG